MFPPQTISQYQVFRIFFSTSFSSDPPTEYNSFHDIFTTSEYFHDRSFSHFKFTDYFFLKCISAEYFPLSFIPSLFLSGCSYLHDTSADTVFYFWVFTPLIPSKYFSWKYFPCEGFSGFLVREFPVTNICYFPNSFQIFSLRRIFPETNFQFSL